MTASGLPEQRTARPAAEAGTSTQAPADATADLPAQAAPTAPEDAQQLKDEIERTREQLGEAVEQLAAKADVKSRAQAAAADLAGRAKNTIAQLGGTAATARQKAISVGQEYRTPLAAAAVSLIAGSLAMRKWRKPQAGRPAGPLFKTRKTGRGRR